MNRRESWIIGSLVALFVASVVLTVLPKHDSGFHLSNGLNTSSVGVLSINGPIDSSDGGMFDRSGLDAILDQIKEFETNTQIKALIVRVNSPGGTVGASQEIFNALRHFKSKTHRPVVISIADLGASGAYWVALAGDVIVANPGSMVGSVGVIMTSPDFHDVPSRYGVGMRTIKSGKYKDMLSSWRTVSPEETQLMQTMLDDIHDQFIAVLIQQRKIPTNDALELAQGQVFSGRQAVDLKLIDALGGFADAVSIAKKRANITGEVELVRNDTPHFEQFISNYLGSKIQFSLSHLALWSEPKIR